MFSIISKSIRLSVLAAVLTMTVMQVSGEATHIVFKSSDGNSHSISSGGLEISFAGETMTAKNATETLTLPVAQLSTMEFTSLSSSVTEAAVANPGKVTVTSIAGVSAGTFSSADAARNALAPGAYVIKTEGGDTYKLIIRQ